MLKIWSSVYIKEKSIKHITVESDKTDMNDALLECLQQICREFDIEMPLWHSKHTKQLAHFHKATFKKDDFIDKFSFDRLTIEIMDAK
jgi:hypothetical protein